MQNMIKNGTLAAHEDDPKVKALRASHFKEENSAQRDANPNGWWVRNVDHTGRPAFNSNSSYKVRRIP